MQEETEASEDAGEDPSEIEEEAEAEPEPASRPVAESPSHWASDCPDRGDQDQSEDAVKDKHTKSEKGTEDKSKVRYVNAIAIVPDDLLSAGDMCDTVNDDKMDVATATEHLDKDYSEVGRTIEVLPTWWCHTAVSRNNAWAVWQEADDDVFRVQMTRGVITVSDNLKLYSKREIQRADAAMDMFKQLGYSSEAFIKRMISGGVLTNCDVTVEALSIYEQVEIFERANQEGDYVIENVDKQLEELQLNREVEEILLPEAGEETNEVNAEDILQEEQHEGAGEATRDTDATANELKQEKAEFERDDNQDDSSDQVEETASEADMIDTTRANEDVVGPEQTPTEEPRYNLRPNRAQAGRLNKRLYGLHLTITQASKAIIKEMNHMLEKEVFHPVYLRDMSREQIRNIICCSMFLKEKYRPDGSFERVKARLVAEGHQQDKTVYADKISSPTVATSSVFMIAIIAAGERREVATVDIPGAYLHADMPSNCVVYMRLNKYLSNLIIQLNCDYANYMTDDGTVIVRLDKGLYGCAQSAKLWCDRLCELLTELGYSINTEDRCVFNRLREDNQTTTCVRVDDLMSTRENKWDIDTAVKQLETAFGSVSVNRGKL
eukprot:gene36291-biopygen592